eukprot:592981-Pelagomonas_calceolata.AAC.5
MKRGLSSAFRSGVTLSSALKQVMGHPQAQTALCFGARGNCKAQAALCFWVSPCLKTNGGTVHSMCTTKQIRGHGLPAALQ